MATAWALTVLFSQNTGDTWVDLGEEYYNWRPNVIMKAAQIATDFEQTLVKIIRLSKREREVIYNHKDPTTGAVTKYKLRLSLFVMPVGAADLAISAGGSSNVHGIFIDDATGVVNPSTNMHYQCAGLMLPFYYKDNGTPSTDRLETTLSAGDAIWVVRGGNIEVHNGSGAAATADGDLLCPAANGKGTISTAWVALGPQTQAIMEERSVNHKNYGIWRAIVADTAVGRADLWMPERRYTP